MTSLKCGHLHTHIIKKGENIKMSAREYIDSSKEEEQMVAKVGGRGRSLVQVLIRVRRERAGRTPQNWQGTQDVRMRPQIQEVGPHGREVQRRPGGLQVWRRQNGITDSVPGTIDADEGQQTVPKERTRTRVQARARPSNPPPTPRLPYNNNLLPVGHFMAPTGAPIAKIFLTIYSPCHATLLTTPTLHPVLKTCFPLVIPYSLTQTPMYALLV